MVKHPLCKFGIEVSKALIDLQMTKTELATKISTSPNYLYLILIGERPAGKFEKPIREVLKLKCKNIAS